MKTDDEKIAELTATLEMLFRTVEDKGIIFNAVNNALPDLVLVSRHSVRAILGHLDKTHETFEKLSKQSHILGQSIRRTPYL